MAPKVDQLGPSTSRLNNIKKHDDIRDIPRVLYDPVQFRQYSLLSYLGKGAYGRCYQVQATPQLCGDDSSTKVALKVISKSTLKDYAHLEKIRKEVAIHSSLNHKNIIKLLSFFEDNANVYMVLELGVYGTLLSNIHASMTGRLSELVARSYMREIVDAVVYIHEVVGILHRDLKPGNILLGRKNQVKLADFGLAVKISDLPKLSHALSGTPNYMSPEVLDNKGHSKESEAWALGCVFYCMVVGKPPFEAETLERTYSRIRGCSYFIPADARISERACNLIHKLLDPDVRRRLKVVDIMNCGYFSSTNSLSTSAQNSPTNQLSNNSFASSYDGTFCGSYQTAVQSRDSGLDSDHMRSPSPDGPMLLLKLLMSRLISVTNQPALCLKSSKYLFEHFIMVNKWVDYTNKYGFGCVLSDGTECVQFFDGSSYAHRMATEYTKETYKLVMDPSQTSPSIYEWTSLDDISDLAINRKMKLAARFSVCMCELQSASSCISLIKNETNYLVYQKRNKGALVMVLSDGTTQINFLETHEKLVLKMDECGEVRVVFVRPGREMLSFQCRIGNKASLPVAYDNRRVYDLLVDARWRIVDPLSPPYFATEC